MKNGKGENWCSVWLGADIEIACMQHDQCYSSSRPGFSQHKCDDTQFLNGEFLCHSFTDDWNSFVECMAVIHTQWLGVRYFAEEFLNAWTDAQKNGCYYY